MSKRHGTPLVLSTSFAVGSFIVIALLGATARAQGGSSGSWFINPALFYSTDVQERNSKSESKSMLLDVKLGFNVGDGVFVGLAYGIDSSDVGTSGFATATDNYVNKTERTSWGPSVGYFWDSFYGFFTYYYSSTWKSGFASSTTTNNSSYDGYGMQADIGFRFPVWGLIAGPQLSYKIFTYSKLSQNGGESTLTPPLKETKLEPYFALWFFF